MMRPASDSLHGRLVLEAHVQRLEQQLAEAARRGAALERRFDGAMEALETADA
jgi:hypothetical protein